MNPALIFLHSGAHALLGAQVTTAFAMATSSRRAGAKRERKRALVQKTSTRSRAPPPPVPPGAHVWAGRDIFKPGVYKSGWGREKPGLQEINAHFFFPQPHRCLPIISMSWAAVTVSRVDKNLACDRISIDTRAQRWPRRPRQPQ